MTTNEQFFPVSGLIEGGITGSHALGLTLLCGIANGSTIVPIAVSGNGVLLTST